MLLCIFKYIYIFSYKGNEKDYIIIYVHSSSNNSYFIFVKPGSFFGEIWNKNFTLTTTMYIDNNIISSDVFARKDIGNNLKI